MSFWVFASRLLCVKSFVMTRAEAKKEHTKLVAEIRSYESTSDKSYLFSVNRTDLDRLKDKLKELEAQFPTLVPRVPKTPKRSEALTEKIKKLRSEIERHNRLYGDGTPEISDFEYDLLVQRLEKLEKRSET